jgi:organic radical activating enzyme
VKPIVKKIEVYITNVCNLTCTDCNRFNNFNFRGWQDWKDYADIYNRWSQLIDLKKIVIMGGEPLLNPTITQWITGLGDAFGIRIETLTNGTRINKVKGLYDVVNRANRNAGGSKNHISVSVHDMDDFAEIEKNIIEFLRGDIVVDPYLRAKWNPTWQWIDKNQVMVNGYQQDHFDNSSIWIGEAGQLLLHDSNPNQAHDACTFRGYESYHFIRGALYKCGPVALMPEFDKQYPFPLTDQERILLNQYRPLTVDNFDDYHEEFFENLNDPIPQCRFCPEHKTQKKIFAIKKSAQLD